MSSESILQAQRVSAVGDAYLIVNGDVIVILLYLTISKRLSIKDPSQFEIGLDDLITRNSHIKCVKCLWQIKKNWWHIFLIAQLLIDKVQ